MQHCWLAQEHTQEGTGPGEDVAALLPLPLLLDDGDGGGDLEGDTPPEAAGGGDAEAGTGALEGASAGGEEALSWSGRPKGEDEGDGVLPPAPSPSTEGEAAGEGEGDGAADVDTSTGTVGAPLLLGEGSGEVDEDETPLPLPLVTCKLASNRASKLAGNAMTWDKQGENKCTHVSTCSSSQRRMRIRCTKRRARVERAANKTIVNGCKVATDGGAIMRARVNSKEWGSRVSLAHLAGHDVASVLHHAGRHHQRRDL